MTAKDKITEINGKKYIQKTSIQWCDEPFKYLEEVPDQLQKMKAVKQGKR